MLTNIDTLKYLMPEGLLIVSACVVALLGASPSLGRIGRLVGLVALVAAAGLLGWQWSQGTSAGADLGVLIDDGVSRLGRMVAVVWAVLFLLMASGDDQTSPAEYAASAMLGFLGLMITSSAYDLTLLFVGLELVSITSYILLGLAGNRRSGLEGALKYFVLSILSSAIMLYGFSFLYGLSGTTDLHGLGTWQLGLQSTPLLATLGLVLVLGGLTFKMAAVPFHFYAADVYEATSYSNAGLLAVLPKAVGVIALLRLALAAGWWRDPFAWQVALALSMITMTLGNVCALRQRNVRRMMAYSSVAHAGYLLIGVTVTMAALSRGQSGTDGAWAVLFYVVGYGLASLGVMAGLVFLSRSVRPLETVDDLAGLAVRFPAVSAAIAVCMFSLTGIPPLGGFLGKLYLLKGALFQALELEHHDVLHQWLVVLSIVTVINAAIAATYYLRIVGALYFGTRSGERGELANDGSASAGASGLAAMFAAVLLVLIGLVPGPLTRWTQSAATDLVGRASAAATIAADRPAQNAISRVP
ncbi:MAG: NADH-quinone oxidoreductase subunit N [Pirellulales bacterium]